MKISKSGLIMLIIGLLAVGFATVSTTLLITGTANIGVNKDDFEVIFASANIPGGITNISKTTKKGDTLTFSTPDISKVDEPVTLNFTVKNNSTQYAADVSIKCYAVDDTSGYLNNYLTVTGKFGTKNVIFASNEGSAILSEPETIVAQGLVKGDVSISLDRPFIGTNKSINVACKLSVEAHSANTVQPSTPFCYDVDTPPQYESGVWIYKDLDCSGDVSMGDYIKVGTEGFYVIKVENNNIRALAEYNLDIDSNNAYEYQGTGIQSEYVQGRPLEDGLPIYGTTKFSTSTYWSTGATIDLNSSYSLIKPYLNTYQTKLGELGANLSEITLITKEEVYYLYNLINNTTNQIVNEGEIVNWAPKWLISSRYFTRSDHPGSKGDVWIINQRSLTHGWSQSEDYFGVRPVIEIANPFI